MRITSKEINAAAHAHTKQVLGDEQFKTNADAVKSVKADFVAGVKWLSGQLKKGATV
jgi:hypothetical protein